MFAAILLAHIGRYPVMQLPDVYKLIHQATLGSEHAIAEARSAGYWLTRELSGMGPGIQEPVIDPISPGGEIVRVHLRPYISAGGRPESLLEAFIRTAHEYQGEIRLLEQYCDIAIGLDERHELPFPVPDMIEYFHRLKLNGYPPVHHSPGYERLYHPAYRVVKKEFLPVDA